MTSQSIGGLLWTLTNNVTLKGLVKNRKMVMPELERGFPDTARLDELQHP